MRIFGIRILREATYQAELVERRALGHREGTSEGAYEASKLWRRLEQKLLLKQVELESQLTHCRARLGVFAKELAAGRPPGRFVEIRPRPNFFTTIQLGNNKIVRIGPHPRFGLQWEIGVDPYAPETVPFIPGPPSGPNDRRRDDLAAALERGDL